MTLNHLTTTKSNVAITKWFSEEGQVALQFGKTQFTPGREKQQSIIGSQAPMMKMVMGHSTLLFYHCCPLTLMHAAKTKSVPQWPAYFCTRETANMQDASSRVIHQNHSNDIIRRLHLSSTTGSLQLACDSSDGGK